MTDYTVEQSSYEKYSKKILHRMKKCKSKQQNYWTFIIDETVNEDEPQPIFYGTMWDAFVKLAKHFPTHWMYFVETAVDSLDVLDIDDLVDEISDWASNSESGVRIVQLQIYE